MLVASKLALVVFICCLVFLFAFVVSSEASDYDEEGPSGSDGEGPSQHIVRIIVIAVVVLVVISGAYYLTKK
jgi:predicted secreted protein